MDLDSPIVEEVRQRALRLSERFDHDLRRYAEHLRQVEEACRDRLVDQVTVIRSVERPADR